MTAHSKPLAALARQDGLAEKLLAGDRRALAQAITLIESSRPDHRAAAEALLSELLPHTGSALRIGISGVPGVGKSTFIECFGLRLIEQGQRVAVLAVDPSSQRGGGAILGDKTRMQALTRSEAAFIRPSPAGSSLGGVARRSREALLLCEAAGFGVVLVETVGVGQSETAVAEMVDLFMLLLSPAGGDELQGLKRGIMELADLLVVNKADGELLAAASRTAADYGSALHLLRPATAKWRPPVLTCSALSSTGIAAVWQAIERFQETLGPDGTIAARRGRQALAWMWREIGEGLMGALKSDPKVAARIPEIAAEVEAGRASPSAAADRMIALFAGQAEGSKPGPAGT